jgi:hypothetical protein
MEDGGKVLSDLEDLGSARFLRIKVDYYFLFGGIQGDVNNARLTLHFIIDDIETGRVIIIILIRGLSYSFLVHITYQSLAQLLAVIAVHPRCDGMTMPGGQILRLEFTIFYKIVVTISCHF